MPTKLQRWLDLIAFLVGRRLPVAYEELMSGVPAYAREYRKEDERSRAALRRKFERDKKELRALGIPLRTVRYTINYGTEEVEGYQIDRRDFYLPYLNLVSEATSAPAAGRPASIELAAADAPLALEGLRRVANLPGFPLVREARSAFRKLAFEIDPGAFAGDDSAVLFIDPPGAPELSARLRELSEALFARKRVRFAYHGIARGSATERDVGPYGLLFQKGHWYLVGHDATRDAIRVFRVARMADVEVNPATPNTPDYEIPANFTLDAYADREAWELGDVDEAPVVAHVRFHFPLSLWAERNGHGQLVERGGDGSQVREFELQQVDPFLRWLLGMQGEVEILEPELQQHLRELARAVADVHGGRSA